MVVTDKVIKEDMATCNFGTSLLVEGVVGDRGGGDNMCLVWLTWSIVVDLTREVTAVLAPHFRFLPSLVMTRSASR